MTAVDASTLRGRWVASCAAGEVVGITAAAALAVGARVAVGEPHDVATAVVVIVAAVAGGVVEGVAVGWFQWVVLRRSVPSVPARAWIGATAAVAVLFWFLATTAVTVVSLAGGDAGAATAGDGAGPPLLVVVAAGAAGGAVAGAAFGIAQWLVLRRHARPAGGWIAANAIGWAVALGWIMLAASLPDAATPLPVVVAGGAVGGLAAGVSVGLVTGWWFVKLAPLRAERRVVIGVGNAFRGDDGVGPAVVADLAGRVDDEVTLLELDGEPARVVDAWRGATLAVVVDAMSSGEAPGTVRRFEVWAGKRLPGASGTSSHSLGVAEAVDLGTALGAMPDELVVYAVEAADFGEGMGLSVPVDSARTDVMAAVLDELGGH